MFKWRYFLGSVLFLTSTAVIAAENGCKGCVTLDDASFDKVINRFDVALVKFDVAYPYGDKHNAYMNFAKEVVNSPELLLAEVGVKDYGDKANEGLAEKYGITKEDLPALRLFIKNKEPLEFKKDADWTIDSVRNFLKDNTNLYIGLPGCLQQFDKFAIGFTNTGRRKEILEEAEKAVSKLSKTEKSTGDIYVKFMKKIIESSNFVTTETARLSKIVNEGKINDKKKEELGLRLNILRSFSVVKDEL